MWARSKLIQTCFRKQSSNILEEFQAATSHALAGGSDKDLQRHTVQNKKLTVIDRLKLLMDDYDNDFIHLSTLAGYKLPYGTIPSASNVVGIGKIRGKTCLVIGNDAKTKGGTMYPISVQKTLRAQDIARENHLPTVYLVDSGGAFLPLQRDIFNPGGKIFRNIALASAKKIPQISCVVGSCTAGGAYIPTMSDQVVMVDKISSIFLGGPPLVQAATGEIVTPEELGGAKIHCNISGYSDFFAENEKVGIRETRNIIETLHCEIDSVPNISVSNSTFSSSSIFDHPENLSGLDLVKYLSDKHEILNQFKPTYSDEITTCFAYVNQNLVGFITNNSNTLSDNALNQASHFVQLCNDRKSVKAVIFLQNGDASIKSDPKTDRNGLARLMSSISVANTPRIAIITNHQHDAFNILSSQYFNPKLLFRWPNAGFQNKNALECSGELYDDGVILPEQTRNYLSKLIPCLKRCENEYFPGQELEGLYRM